MTHQTDRLRSAGHAQRRELLLAEERFLGCWATLQGLGAEEQQILEAISKEDLGSSELTAIARAGACALAEKASLAKVIEEGKNLSFWVQVLLAAEPRQGVVLKRAAEVVAAEARDPWSRGRLWSKLRLLALAGARLGDGFGALAREAREREQSALAEGFYAAAREARKGADLPAAMRAIGGLSPLERLCLLKLDDDSDAALAALEAVATYTGTRDPLEESAFEGFAQAASETAAPLRRGLEGLLSKVEGALGIERAPSPRASLARKALEARGRQVPQPAAKSKGAVTQSEAARAEAARSERVEDNEVNRPPAAHKTIGGDSGPVSIGRLQDTALEAWAMAFDEARAKMTLLEVQPDEAGIAQELRGEIGALRSGFVGGLATSKRRAQLAELEDRFSAWQRERGEL